MRDDAPVVRASYAKTVIATMKTRPQPEREQLLGRVDPQLRLEIREYGLFDWMDADRFAELANLVADVLSEDRAMAFWHANLLGSLEGALLSSLRLGAVALYGKHPGALLRMTPHAWQLVSKHCGTCKIIEEPAGMTLRFEELPGTFCSRGLLLLWSGGSESCIERMGFAGRAEGSLDPSMQGAVDVHVHWHEVRRG